MWVHLVDGTYELFRAHYSKRPEHRAPAGWDAKATVGVVQSLINMMWDPHEKVTHLAVAFDNPIVSFRNALFDGYKTDDGIDPALRSAWSSGPWTSSRPTTRSPPVPPCTERIRASKRSA